MNEQPRHRTWRRFLGGGSGTAEAAATATPEACPIPKTARRLGAAAFLFFFIKGMLWLTVPAGIAAWRMWFGE